jgi:nucleoside phosphorylase
MLCGVAGGLDPALGVGDVVVGTSHIQHDYGTHREGYFLTIQPGSRPSRGDDDWQPGYPEPSRWWRACARRSPASRSSRCRRGRRRPRAARRSISAPS